MKFTNTFLVVALLTFSFTNTFEFASLAEVSEINASSYGKSLLETISLTLEQKGNVGEIQQLLNDLLFKLNQDQARDTAAWNKENARLKAKIARLTKEIEALRVEILRLLAEKAKYEKLRDQAAANLVQYRKQLAHNMKALVQNAVRRAADNAEFKKSQGEHTDILNALDAVLKELSKLQGSVAGAGKPQHVRLNAEEKRDAAAKLSKAFVQISQDEADIQAFIETATEADQNALKTLMDAIRNIRENTEKSYNDDVAHEKRSLRDFNNLNKLLKKDNRRLNAMVVEETRNHKLYVRRVAELTVKIAQTRKLRKAKMAEKKSTVAERLAKEKKYLADKAQRDEERRVIKRIEAIVVRRLANMSKYLNEKL
jgi:hypothetical protein